jgi:hyperosmotically inducible periplasmic protein
MKKINFLVLVAVAALAISFTACKSKPKDADIKAAVEKALSADGMDGMIKGSSVTVEKGVATISGECKDAECKASCEKAVAAIKGVKSVVNNCTVMPPIEVAADDPLTKSVMDAIKSFSGVTANVKDGIVSLGGAIKKADLQKLMMALNALKPKKIETAGLTKN